MVLRVNSAHQEVLLVSIDGSIEIRRSLLTYGLAGLGAGMTEAVFAVTPSETIK